MKIVNMPSSNGFDKLHKQGAYIPYSLLYQLRSTDETLLISQFQYWLNSKNSGKFMPVCIDSNGVAIKNCKWARDSIRDLQKTFKIWSHAKINRLLHKLIDQKILLVANLKATRKVCSKRMNFSGFDQTSWYTLNNIKLQDLYEQSNYAKEAQLTTNTYSHKVSQNDTTSVTNCHTRMHKVRHRLSQSETPIVTKRDDEYLRSHTKESSKKQNRTDKNEINKPSAVQKSAVQENSANNRNASSKSNAAKPRIDESIAYENSKKKEGIGLDNNLQSRINLEKLCQDCSWSSSQLMITKLQKLQKCYGLPLVRYGMQYLAMRGITNGFRGYNYLVGCLRNWRQEGLSTPSDVKKHSAKYYKERKNKASEANESSRDRKADQQVDAWDKLIYGD